MSNNVLKISVTDMPEIKEALSNANKEIERLNNIIKEVREYINWRLEEHQDMYKYQMEELLEILDKEGNVDE